MPGECCMTPYEGGNVNSELIDCNAGTGKGIRHWLIGCPLMSGHLVEAIPDHVYMMQPTTYTHASYWHYNYPPACALSHKLATDCHHITTRYRLGLLHLQTRLVRRYTQYILPCMQQASSGTLYVSNKSTAPAVLLSVLLQPPST